jgi:hypothetical protein
MTRLVQMLEGEITYHCAGDSDLIERPSLGPAGGGQVIRDGRMFKRSLEQPSEAEQDRTLAFKH